MKSKKTQSRKTENKTENNKISFNKTIFWIIIGLTLTIIGGSYILGKDNGEAKNYVERVKCKDEQKILKDSVNQLKDSIRLIIKQRDSIPPPYDIFANGKLGQGLELGVDTDTQKRDWVGKVGSDGVLCMSYPKGQNWGVVFISVGKAESSFDKRKWKNCNGYSKLVVELKGNPGDEIEIGLKDNDDPDNGIETKIPIALKGEWETVEIELKEFKTAYLKQLYILTEFVFAEKANICIKRIQFI
ncbi:MAG: hypothetical protein LBT29_02745 [Flavobacteriaceae bacterium]|nr:hypothetical protein [Flavobacteriaceae bacterium]